MPFLLKVLPAPCHDLPLWLAPSIIACLHCYAKSTLPRLQDAIIHTKFKVNNSRQCYEELLDWVGTHMVGTASRGVIFAIETASQFNGDGQTGIIPVSCRASGLQP